MQATEKKSINKIWLAAISVIAVAALILGIVALVNHGDTKANAIPTINQQVDNIKNTLPELEKVSTELKGYIDTLETTVEKLQSDLTATNTAIDTLKKELGDDIDENEQALLDKLTELKTTIEGHITAITTSIETLAKNDEQLVKNITDLKTYVDTGLQGNKDWANATFSTLEQYEATQTTISEIKALIKNNQDSITALETKLNKKIADDIAEAVAGVNADIAAKVTEITNGYKTAIANASDTITSAYTDAIKKAITDSETSMKEWVNGVLAEGYYTKAEMDGKITALQTHVAEGDAALQKEIDDLEAALAKAESDLTTAYEKAIADAITENNGKISAEIAATVKTAQDNLQAQIDAINSEIEKIKARLDIIEADINSINQQITAINGTIDDLKRVDGELKGYIDGLQNSAADLQLQIDDTNTALAALESDLGGQISASEQKVLNELNTVRTALEGHLATINNTIATLTSQLTAIGDRITLLESAVAECATQEDVNVVQQELATVQSDMAAMKTDVRDLQTKMATVEGEVDSLQSDVADLGNRVGKLENDFANRIQSITFIPGSYDGKVMLDYISRTVILDFRISPASLAEKITAGNVKAYAHYTDDPVIRGGANDAIPLTVSSVTGDENGMLEVTISESSASLFKDDFWNGSVEAVIYIEITDANGNNIVSESIPMIAHNYAGNTNRIGGFGDGGTYNGEAGN